MCCRSFRRMYYVNYILEINNYVDIELKKMITRSRKRQRTSEDEEDFSPLSRRKPNVLSDLPDDIVKSKLSVYFNSEVDKKIELQKAKRAVFQVKNFDPLETDPEIKFRYLLRTVSGLTDDLKIKLKVFLCITPTYTIPDGINHDMISTLTSHIEIVTSETTKITCCNINVLHPMCQWERINSNLQDECTELYITPGQFQAPSYSLNRLPNWVNKIALYSFTLELEDDFCSRLDVKHLNYAGMSSVIKIGHGWMEACSNLKSINFNGLSSLTVVGVRWMRECEQLVSPNFAGLSALTTVDSSWMRECLRLTSPNFNGLSALTTVNTSWMDNCNSLISPNFNGLSALITVGSFWMHFCRQLVSPNFSGLSALSTVGHFWMSNCDRLVSPNFAGLSALTTVGFEWMDECRSSLIDNATKNFVTEFRARHPNTR